MIVQYTIIHGYSLVVNCILQIGDFFSAFFGIRTIFEFPAANRWFRAGDDPVKKRPEALFFSAFSVRQNNPLSPDSMDGGRRINRTNPPPSSLFVPESGLRLAR